MSNRKRTKDTSGQLVREQLKRFRRTQQQLLERKIQAGSFRLSPDDVRKAARTIEDNGTKPIIEERS